MSPKPMARGLSVLLIACCCSLHLAAATRTHREHKVHNIVLYPDKHSWCKTTPIKQVVAWPGCVAREIDNNVCVGACFSYTIPQTEPSAPGDVISPYCDSCQPSEVTWLELTLECTTEEEPVETLAPEPTTTPQPNSSLVAANTTILMQKRVQVIANCSCSACHGHSHHSHAASPSEAHEDAAHPQPSLLDVPELMGLMRQVHTRKLANQSSAAAAAAAAAHHHSTGVHLPLTLPESPETEEEENKEEIVSSTDPPPVVPSEETLALPSAEFEPPVPLPSHFEPPVALPSHAAFEPPVPLPSHAADPVGGHGHHGHHAHAHHTHHHGHHHTAPAHLEVPQEKLQPAQEGAEMSYLDNLVPSDQSQEKDEEF